MSTRTSWTRSRRTDLWPLAECWAGVSGALLIIDAQTETAVRAGLHTIRGWCLGHLEIASIETWNILLNGHRL